MKLKHRVDNHYTYKGGNFHVSFFTADLSIERQTTNNKHRYKQKKVVYFTQSISMCCSSSS